MTVFLHISYKFMTTRNGRATLQSVERLGLDLVSGEIVCSDLTTDDVGDPTALPNLLDQIDDPVDLFLAPSCLMNEMVSV